MQGLADFGMDIPDWLCRRAMMEFFTEYKKQVQVIPGAQDLLSSLKARGKKVGIVANCTIYEDIFHDVFRSVGLAEFIDGYAFSYSHGVRKPNPRLFKRALDVLGASPQKAVMVGDRLDTDICGAKKLGIATVWYNPSGLPGDGLIFADREVRRLRCLLE
jgi:putative hydrolase of the HAD superfamily